MFADSQVWSEAVSRSQGQPRLRLFKCHIYMGMERRGEASINNFRLLMFARLYMWEK